MLETRGAMYAAAPIKRSPLFAMLRVAPVTLLL
jgi:hypothetical protein